MASDQEIAKCLEAILRQSDPNSFTTFNGVVQQLEAKLGLDLSQKAGFIRDQINFLLRSHPPQPLPPRDHFALQHHPQFPNTQPQFHPHFALQPQQQQPQQPQQHQQHRPEYNLNFLNPFQPQLPQAKPPTQPQLRQPQVQPAQVVKTEANVQDVKPNVSDAPKER